MSPTSKCWVRVQHYNKLVVGAFRRRAHSRRHPFGLYQYSTTYFSTSISSGLRRNHTITMNDVVMIRSPGGYFPLGTADRVQHFHGRSAWMARSASPSPLFWGFQFPIKEGSIIISEIRLYNVNIVVSLVKYTGTVNWPGGGDCREGLWDTRSLQA